MSHLLLLASLLTPTFSAMAAPQDPAQVTQRLQVLLEVDRLQFYSYSLADQIEKKGRPDIAEGLRQLTPEDYLKHLPKGSDLTKIEAWDELLRIVLTKTIPSLQTVSASDLGWSYNFYKKKIFDGFKLKTMKDLVAPNPWNTLTEVSPTGRDLVIPARADRSKVLLETERYISEKTTRAMFWEAIESNRRIEFHVGTEQDFRETVRQRRLNLIVEISPQAHNYNRLSLVQDPATGELFYTISSISGQDRVRHFMAQLQLIRWQNKGFEGQKVRLMSSWVPFHDRLTERLTDHLKTLPKADFVVIGQKGSLESALLTSLMVRELQRQAADGIALEPSIQRLLTQAERSQSALTLIGEGAKLRKELERIGAEKQVSSSPALLTVEHPSHEFSDYLLKDAKGKVQRWRVFSAVWGDEIIPIARSLKNSGHREVVYIGTAGALEGKGVALGDLISAKNVLSHDNQILEFSEGRFAQDVSKKGLTVGQVRTPFEETERWLQESRKNFDIVEVETGLLRKELGSQARLEAYFLISDVVGSEGESLAAAVQNAGRRKNSQLKLLESLFSQKGLVETVIDSSESNRDFDRIYTKFEALKPNRDPFSLAQMALKAQRLGMTTEMDIAALLEVESNFDRRHLLGKLTSLDQAFQTLLRLTGESRLQIVDSPDLQDGILNPKAKPTVKIQIGSLNEEQVLQRLQKNGWNLEPFLKEMNLQILGPTEDGLERSGLTVTNKDAKTIRHHFEREVYRKNGLLIEVNASGDWRLRRIPQAAGGWRCEAVFL
ncbi:MAG: hypothetical protein KF789_13305 [Bdellovibrionaceae bacterium]|nr:hypothetical protein [Pseudobdellovibrionaceae bacterium]